MGRWYELALGGVTYAVVRLNRLPITLTEARLTQSMTISVVPLSYRKTKPAQPQPSVTERDLPWCHPLRPAPPNQVASAVSWDQFAVGRTYRSMCSALGISTPEARPSTEAARERETGVSAALGVLSWVGESRPSKAGMTGEV